MNRLVFVCLTAMLLFLVIVSAAVIADDEASQSDRPGDGEKQEIARLIEELNSPEFKTRESAEAKLLNLGLPALEALEHAAKNSSQPQTLFRTKRILAVLREKSLGYISLAGNANHKLAQRLGRFEGNTLDSLPRGEQKFDGLKFKIEDDVVLLGGRDLPDKPRSVKGIAVKQLCGQLNFLHAMSFGSNVREGDEVAKYVIHYADETQEEISIFFGVDMRDWWNYDDSKPVTRGRVAWRGNNRVAESAGHSLRLYATTWKNPSPEKVVSHIDFVATHDFAAPFCIAITAQGE